MRTWAVGCVKGMALMAIRSGEADLVITGGAESATTPLSVSGFASAKALSTRNEDPSRASRPFDIDRDGFVLGEGAGILVFEEYERAKRRGAPVYAEVKGYGSTDDAFHITAPKEDGSGPARAFALALRSGGVDPETVDYVNAHGTSTPYNDAIETRAIHRCFGDHARRIAISSTKSMIGHLLGASSAVELVVTAFNPGSSYPLLPQANIVLPAGAGNGASLGSGTAGTVIPGALRVAVANPAGANVGQGVPNIGIRLFGANDDALHCVGEAYTALTDSSGVAVCDLQLPKVAGEHVFDLDVGRVLAWQNLRVQATE